MHAAVSSSSEAKDLGGEKSICLHSLFLLTVEAQKKWVVEGADPYSKKKDAVFMELRAPHPRQRGFLKKAPLKTEKHTQTRAESF